MDSITNLLSTRSAELAINAFVLFFQLKFNFLCPCEKDRSKHIWLCLGYIFGPAVMFFFCSMAISCCRIPCSCRIFGKAVLSAFLWVSLVLFDGDLIVCMLPDTVKLTCKQEANLTETERTLLRTTNNNAHVSNYKLVFLYSLYLIMVF